MICNNEIEFIVTGKLVRYETGPIPANVIVIGFSKQRGGESKLVPRALGMYTKYRGDEYRISEGGTLHRAERIDYWIQVEAE